MTRGLARDGLVPGLASVKSDLEEVFCQLRKANLHFFPFLFHCHRSSPLQQSASVQSVAQNRSCILTISRPQSPRNMVCREGEVPKPGTARYFEWQNDDKGPSIIIVCWVFTALALLFLVARLFVRGHILKKFHADDLWCSLGWVGVILSLLL